VVVQRRGEDLRRARGALIDERDDRNADARPTFMCGLPLALAAAPADRDDRAVVEEQIGGGDRLIDEPARVIT
jgi:hypothetical protein